MGKICGKCNGNNDDNANFCFHCGAGFDENNYAKKCLNCGNELRDEQSFCNKCGHAIVSQSNSNIESDINNATKHEKVRCYNDKMNTNLLKLNKKFTKGAAIVYAILSIILMIAFYKDLGFWVLLIPVFLFVGLWIIDLKFIIHRKVSYHVVDAMNDVMNKDK